MARGRKAGSKNIKREGEFLVNQHDIKFTDAEKRKLESLVNSANRKRRRILKAEGDLERFVAGRATGQSIAESVGRMGKESDFVLAKKTKSLNRFRTKKDYDRYIANLERVVKRDYISERVKQYRDNWAKSIESVYGEDKEAQELIKRIETLDVKEYIKAVQEDEALEISEVYMPTNEKDKQFKKIKKAVERVAPERKKCPKCGDNLRRGKGNWKNYLICENRRCNYKVKLS